LILFGCGSNCATYNVLTGKALSVDFGWGIGILFGVLVSSGISGGHINPAVSLSMALFGRLEWRKVGYYCLA